MKNQLAVPAFADLAQDIAGSIPIELVQAWILSAGDGEAQRQLLDPYRRTGTIVCSDAAGLSKMTAARPLVEVMKLVNEPKEIIYAHGKSIGGDAVGTWTADNTQMFYDGSIDPNLVVLQMMAAQREMANCVVKVGIGMHYGDVYEIGGGLFGKDADDIEEFTEEETKGGEIVVTKTLLEMIEPSHRTIEVRHGRFVLEIPVEGNSASISHDVNYPTPFPPAFHQAIRALDTNVLDDVDALHCIYAKLTCVVLVRIFHTDASLMLDAFVARVLANVIVHRVARVHSAEIQEANGATMILTMEDSTVAVRLAQSIINELRTAGFLVNVGVCKGEVLMFRFENGETKLAGSPVNIASKLAEDTAARGKVYFEASVAEVAKQQGASIGFECVVSNVVLSGVEI